MSVGLMCDCPRPPMHNLRLGDRGHAVRPNAPATGKSTPGCPNYAEDQVSGGRCAFCADADRIAIAAIAREYDALAALAAKPKPEEAS